MCKRVEIGLQILRRRSMDRDALRAKLLLERHPRDTSQSRSGGESQLPGVEKVAGDLNEHLFLAQPSLVNHFIGDDDWPDDFFSSHIGCRP
jgi:hypothetical protein